MQTKSFGSRFLSLVVLASLIAGSLGLAFTGWLSGTPAAHAQGGNTATYLPLLNKNFHADTIFGVEHSYLGPGSGVDYLVGANTSFVRRNALLWADVEPTQGARNWSAQLDLELKNAATLGLRVVLIIRKTPVWAQKTANSFCGPIRSDAFQAFADFMRDVVTRYSAAPYYVQYYELFNEPDVMVSAADPEFGCWGAEDDYYGGQYYGQMLKVAYPAIKAANPNVQVLTGGLLLDCDPNITGLCTDTRPPRFLEGILLTGAGSSFDGVSFHAYDYYPSSGTGRYLNPNWATAWNTSGPVLIRKAQFLRATLQKYGVTGKFLMNTESAMVKTTSGCDSICETTKAYYLAQAYGAALKEGLRANIWYALMGWRESQLLDGSYTPLPAANAFKASRMMLGQATFAREVTTNPNVRVYEYTRPNGRVWLLWSLDGGDHSFDLPDTPQAVRDVFGAEVAYSGGPLMVGLSPQYIEWNP